MSLSPAASSLRPFLASPACLSSPCQSLLITPILLFSSFSFWTPRFLGPSSQATALQTPRGRQGSTGLCLSPLLFELDAPLRRAHPLLYICLHPHCFSSPAEQLTPGEHSVHFTGDAQGGRQRWGRYSRGCREKPVGSGVEER